MQKITNTVHTQTGSMVVEIMLALAMLILFVAATIGLSIYAQTTVVFSGQKSRALLLAQEGMEALRQIRDASFASLADGAYGLSLNDNQWALQTEPDTQGVFTRRVTIQSAPSGDKEVIVTITWAEEEHRPGSVELATLLGNWRNAQ